MTEATVIDRAVAAIGEGRKDDSVLRPTKHAEELAAKAPALSRLLRTGKMQTYKNQCEHHDEAANKAQERFKRATSLANGAVLVTGVLGALIMVVGILAERPTSENIRYLLIALGLGTVVCGAFASMWLFRVREGQMLDDWMSERARAETARLTYFKTLVQMNGGGGGELPLSLLKLEYFRRYLLDTQINYYRNSMQKHRRSADRTLAIGGFAAAIAAVASGSAGIVAAYEAPWAAFAAFGVLGTALAAYAATREAFNQDRRNADRYRNTLSSLEILRAELDEARAGVLGGDPQAVLDNYVAAVQEQLSREHNEWLSGAENTRAAIGKLDDSVAKSLTKPKAADPLGQASADTS